MPWTTSPEPVSRRVRLAHQRAPYRWSSSFVARSMPFWPSATTNGITRPGFSLSRKQAADSPIEPVDVRAIRAAGCTRTLSCTVSYSLHCATRRVPDRRTKAKINGFKRMWPLARIAAPTKKAGKVNGLSVLQAEGQYSLSSGSAHSYRTGDTICKILPRTPTLRASTSRPASARVMSNGKRRLAPLQVFAAGPEIRRACHGHQRR